MNFGPERFSSSPRALRVGNFAFVKDFSDLVWVGGYMRYMYESKIARVCCDSDFDFSNIIYDLIDFLNDV